MAPLTVTLSNTFTNVLLTISSVLNSGGLSLQRRSVPTRDTRLFRQKLKPSGHLATKPVGKEDYSPGWYRRTRALVLFLHGG